MVFTAVVGRIDVPALRRMWRISKMDFVCGRGRAQLSCFSSGFCKELFWQLPFLVLILVARASHPHVAFLGRVPGTNSYSDLDRHPENEPLANVVAFRPEASLLYVNAELVFQAVSKKMQQIAVDQIDVVVCDLSASPYIDLAGSRMLHQLHNDLASRDIALRIVGARGRVRDLLRADGIGAKVGGLDRLITLDSLLSSLGKPSVAAR